jgi:type VI secretion system protein ImpF
MTQIRRSVLRDMEWLFNTSAKWTGDEIEDFPQVVSSVLNYGIPDLCGLTSSSVEPIEVERAVEEAIRHFEPRILSNSLTVIADADADEVGTNAVRFEIRGMLWAQPLPEQLYVKTNVDLETGNCKIQESPHG